MPVRPPASSWSFGRISADTGDLIGLGADLAAGTLLEAYRRGLFPMYVDVDDQHQLGWWSPDPRGVLPLDGLRVTRSLRRSCRRFRVTVDRAPREVITACAEQPRDGTWIHDDISAAYLELHRMGWMHSIEVWDDGDRLVGGLYGVACGLLFAGESMFHIERDASKVALVGLVSLLGISSVDAGWQRDDVVLDVQWATDHLKSLGVIEVPRRDYLRRIRTAAAVERDLWAPWVGCQVPLPITRA